MGHEPFATDNSLDMGNAARSAESVQNGSATMEGVRAFASRNAKILGIAFGGSVSALALFGYSFRVGEALYFNINIVDIADQSLFYWIFLLVAFVGILIPSNFWLYAKLIGGAKISKLIPKIMLWSVFVSAIIVVVFQFVFPLIDRTLSQAGDCFEIAWGKAFLDFCVMLVALPLLLFMFGWLCFCSFNGHSSRKSATQDPGSHSSDNQLKKGKAAKSKSDTEINPSVRKGLTCTFVFGAVIIAIIAVGWWYSFCSVQFGNIQVIRSQELSLAERASEPSSYAIVMRVDDSLVVEELQVDQNGKPVIDTTQYFIVSKSGVSIAQYRSLVQEE